MRVATTVTMTSRPSEPMGECDRETHPKEGLVFHSHVVQTVPSRGAVPTDLAYRSTDWQGSHR